MLETLQSFLLFGSYVWFWIAAGIFLFCLFVADLNEAGFFGTFSAALFLSALYFWGNVNPQDYFRWDLLFAYLSVGIFYALLRTYFFARKRGENGKRELKEHVFRWWLMWPISLINWFVSDVIVAAYNYWYKLFGNIFEKVYDWGLKDSKEK